MLDPSIHRAVRCPPLFMLLLLTLVLLFTTSLTFAVAIGDQVELKATHQAGVPLHQEPHGTHDFQRIPDGTRARVIDTANNGQWLNLSLPDGRTGWVTSRYVGRTIAGTSRSAPSPSTPTLRPATPTAPDASATGKKPQRIEEGTVTRVADGDTVTVITANQTKLRIRMFGIDAPETPKGTKFPGQPYGKEAEAYLNQLVKGKQVTVEMYGVDRYKRLLAVIFLDRQDINLAMIEAGLAEVYRGPESGNPYKPQYQAAEETARSAKRSMWVQGDSYESPRAYRKRVGIS